MIIKEPSCELWQQTDPITHVARCARVCYGSKEGKSTDQQLYDNLLKAKHNSMFRHESVYLIIPRYFEDLHPKIEYLYDCPYVNIKVLHKSDGYGRDGEWYISTNRNWVIDNKELWHFISGFEVPADRFKKELKARNLIRYTFHITTQISTSRELNRVSPNAIAEKSTRYVDESDGAIVRPHWMSKDIAFVYNHNGHGTAASIDNLYLAGCEAAFTGYKALIKQGLKRQDARGVLPLDTATEVIYTYSVDEWKHIIELRSSKKAHHNCQIIANMIREQLKQLGYDL